MSILIISFIFIFICVCISLFLIKPDSTTTCSDNEMMVQNKCECKDGFQRDDTKKCIMTCGENEIMIENKCECKNTLVRDENNTCIPDYILIAKFPNGHNSNFEPIIIKGLGIIYVNEKGLYLEESLIKGLDTFSCSSSDSSVMLCDTKGMIYLNN